METLDQAGLLALELGAEQVPEQVVVAVPLAVAVERDYQQVPGFHLFEDGSGTVLLQDRVAQRSAHPVQDRRAAEERRLRGRDPGEKLRAQVVAHIDVVAGEGETGIALPGAGLDGQRGDVQPGWPPFSPLQEIPEAGLVGLDSCSLQQRVRLRRCHGQVIGGDLEYPALSTQPRRRQRHDGARRQRKLPARRQVQGELGDRIQALLVRDRLGVVEQYSHGRRHRGDGGHEAGDAGDIGT